MKFSIHLRARAPLKYTSEYQDANIWLEPWAVCKKMNFRYTVSVIDSAIGLLGIRLL